MEQKKIKVVTILLKRAFKASKDEPTIHFIGNVEAPRFLMMA